MLNFIAYVSVENNVYLLISLHCVNGKIMYIDWYQKISLSVTVREWMEKLCIDWYKKKIIACLWGRIMHVNLVLSLPCLCVYIYGRKLEKLRSRELITEYYLFKTNALLVLLMYCAPFSVVLYIGYKFLIACFVSTRSFMFDVYCLGPGSSFMNVP